MSSRVYLDYNATTPLAPEVLESMLPFLRGEFGNPSSVHGFGRTTEEALLSSRVTVATFLGADPEELVFTGGGTEADNLALVGSVGAAETGERRHLVCSNIEHHAVLEVMRELERRGWPLTIVDVDEHGRLTRERLERVLREDTLLVSVMFANNETGVVQPIAELARATHDAGALFHTDAVQACGKIPVDVNALGVDLLSLSAHKFYGPKGVGALYVREGTPLAPVLLGGGQERGRRGGTENVPGIIGLAEACRRVQELLPSEGARLARLRDAMESRALDDIDGCHVNGGGAARTPNTVNFRFDDASGEMLVRALDSAGFAVSTGAACDAGATKPSHVLVGMGLRPDEVQGTIRVSLGRYTREEEVEAFSEALPHAVRLARSGERNPVSSG